MVRIRCFHCHPGSIPDRGTEIPQAMGRDQNFLKIALEYNPLTVHQAMKTTLFREKEWA